MLIATLATLMLSAGAIVTGELLRMTAPRAVAVFTPRSRGRPLAGRLVRRWTPSHRRSGRDRHGEPEPLQPAMTADVDARALAKWSNWPRPARRRRRRAQESRCSAPPRGEGITADGADAGAADLARDAGWWWSISSASSPTIAAVSVDPAAPGLAELMLGEASFAQIITRDRLSRVHLVSAGRPGFDRALLQSPRLTLAIDALLRVYDHVLLDAGTASDLPAELLTAQARAVVVPDASMTPMPASRCASNSGRSASREVTMLSRPVQPSDASGRTARRGGVVVSSLSP